VATISAAFSIGTMDEDVWRQTEPGTPSPRARMEAVRTLNDAGIPTGVLIAPVLPGISDGPGQVERVVEAAVAAGATHASPILLHLRPGVREEFLPWLEANRPDLVARYRSLYRSAYAPAAERGRLSRRVDRTLAGIGRPIPASGFRQVKPTVERRSEEQLKLC
jgi:DNA repair photolyase